MSAVRPDVLRQLRRWRESLLGAGIALAGVWLALNSFGVLSWLAWVAAALGTGLILAGVQRGRFRQGHDGPGVVRVDEGQIAYFGPFEGGIAALSEITQVALDRTGDTPSWRIRQPGRADLIVPVNADGAEALFDAFGALQSFDTRTMLAALHSHDRHSTIIWENPALRLR